MLVTAGALAVAGVVVARSDADMRDARLATQLEPRAQAAAALVYYEEGKLVLDDLKTDDVAKQPLLVLTGVPPATRVFSAGPEQPPATAVAAVAAEAATTEEVASLDATGPDGHALRLTAAAFYDESGKVAGATVVVGDPGPAAREHRRLLAGLGLGGVGGLLVVAAATSLLVGLRIRGADEAVRGADQALAAPRE